MNSESENSEKVTLRPSRSMQECRLDFLLEEELAVDPEFLPTFVVACKWDIVPIHLEQVVLQFRPNPKDRLDVVAIFSASQPDGRKITAALLIEDKITSQ